MRVSFRSKSLYDVVAIHLLLSFFVWLASYSLFRDELMQNWSLDQVPFQLAQYFLLWLSFIPPILLQAIFAPVSMLAVLFLRAHFAKLYGRLHVVLIALSLHLSSWIFLVALIAD